MPGPAPKLASERANRSVKAFGEWRTLPPIVEPILPSLPMFYGGDLLDAAMTDAIICICGRVGFVSEHALAVHIGRAKDNGKKHARFVPFVPPEMRWSPSTAELWEGFRFDFATQEYGPSEIAQARQLARLIEEANRADKSAAMWAEVRQWMDRLMLSPKGKRDARLMLGDPAKVMSLRSVGTEMPNFKRTAAG